MTKFNHLGTVFVDLLDRVSKEATLTEGAKEDILHSIDVFETQINSILGKALSAVQEAQTCVTQAADDLRGAIGTKLTERSTALNDVVSGKAPDQGAVA